MQPAFFREGHEERAGFREDAGLGRHAQNRLLVGLAGDGAGRADDADAPAARPIYCGPRARSDDAEHGNLKFVAQGIECVGGSRVACDDEHLNAAFHEQIGAPCCIAPDGFAGFRAVGHPGRVAQVNDGFMGKIFGDARKDRQAADARVEDSDRIA